jgi:predicted dehydrogenase
MASRYRVVVVGAGRMGGTIDDEVMGHPYITLPMSHGAAYAALPETELVGFADPILTKAQGLAARYSAPQAEADYRVLIARVRPEIISVCTRPGDRAEIIEFAVKAGVRAIYCEKPLCASMEDADRIVEACESAGVAFNMGTNRRFLPGYRRLREELAGGLLGDLRCVTANCAGRVLWSHSHAADMLLMLAGDPEVEFVQGHCEIDPADFDDNRTEEDPVVRMGYVRFRNGVDGYLTAAPGWDFDLHGTTGTLRTLNDLGEARLWKRSGRWNVLNEAAFPFLEQESAPLLIIRDLIRVLENGGETQNGVHLARRSQEIMMAMVESERQGGARVPLPLANRSLYVGRW